MAHPEPRSLVWLPIVSILMIMAIFISGLFAPLYLPKGGNWALVMILMSTFFALIGKLKTGRFSGVFINERYKMSLSRFQLVIWTLIVLSAFLTIALERIGAGVLDPLAIELPTQLWALLGISTTSLVGSPLVLSTKIEKKPTDAAISNKAKLHVEKEEERMLARRKKEDESVFEYNKRFEAAKKAIEDGAKRFGTLDFNKEFKDAKLSDMFTGDELENSPFVDIAKVQMFFFTLIIAFSYMVLLVNLIMTADPAGLNSFPELSDGLVALLGISSAGYLTNKAPDHTQTERAR